MRIGHGPVALDVAEDLARIVPDLKTPPVAGIINVSDLLPMRVDDVGARRGRGGRGAIPLKFETAGLCRQGNGDQDHG